MQNKFSPEGFRIGTDLNDGSISSLDRLEHACSRSYILEANAISYSAGKTLKVALPCAQGIIPFEECALGMAEGLVREISILSRVGKPVCFTVKKIDTTGASATAILSRREAQSICSSQYIQSLRPGDIVDGCVTRLDPFGCFVDIGCGLTFLLPLDSISYSRIRHPSERFCVGQRIRCAIRRFDDQNRIVLTHKELLGSWDENAALFSAGETVVGIVRSVEPYGIFIELTPNLSGLAEPQPGVKPGMSASVYIKSIQPDRMKVKLAIIDCFPRENSAPPFHYFYHGDSMRNFLFSSADCGRLVETKFL